MTTLSLLTLGGGIAVLLYGLELVQNSLQKLAGARLRPILSSVTQNRFLGLLFGAVVTSVIQSNAATTVLLVGFTSAGLLNLSQAIAVILGAGIGTTVTVQLIAFDVQEYGLGVVFVGFLLYYFGTDPRVRTSGSAILGFGFVLFSLRIVSETTAPLQASDLFRDMLQALGSSPLLGVLVAAFLAALLQSSAALIGLTLVLAGHGLLALREAVPIVLGANVGSGTLTLLTSLGGPIEARRVAVANIAFKAAGCALALALLDPFSALVAASAGGAARQIANAHTLFNLTLAALLLPFTGRLARWVAWLVPERATAAVPPSQPKYIDLRSLDTPALALAQATRESLRMSDIARDMYADTARALLQDNQTLVEEIEARDDWLDHLNREIKLFLTKLSSHSLTEEQAARKVALLALVSDLENIGDIIERHIMELAKKKIYKSLRFSEPGLREILELHAMIGKNFDTVMLAFGSNDVHLARQVIEFKRQVTQRERVLRAAHLQRLSDGLRESIETSSIHLDVLANLVRINHHVTSIAYPIAEAK